MTRGRVVLACNAESNKDVIVRHASREGLQHLATGGRTAPELQAKSRHQHLASLGRYVRLGEQTSARVTAEADPAARRRTR